MIDGMKAAGEDIDTVFDSYVRLYKTIFSGRKALFLDLVLGMHFCRGNFRSRHFSEGGYEKIAVRLFNQIDFDVYYLEYDTKRAGTLDAQKHLPRDKMVVLGLVTSKFPELEDVDVLEKRVREAAGIIASGTGETEEEALERICVSPQCGFASSYKGNLVTAEDMRRKLELVVGLAKRIW